MEIDASTRADLTSVSITADFTGHAEAFEGRVEISSDAGVAVRRRQWARGTDRRIQGTRRLQFGFDDLPLGGGAFRVAVSACEPGSTAHGTLTHPHASSCRDHRQGAAGQCREGPGTPHRLKSASVEDLRVLQVAERGLSVDHPQADLPRGEQVVMGLNGHVAHAG